MMVSQGTASPKQIYFILFHGGESSLFIRINSVTLLGSYVDLTGVESMGAWRGDAGKTNPEVTQI